MLHSLVKRTTSTPCRRLVSILALTSAAGVAMLAFRFAYSGMRGYWSLPWDLFLAWVPVPLALAVARLQERGISRRAWPAIVGLGLLWLLFFPNAPYLLTEFMHLDSGYAVYDGPLPAGLDRYSAGGPIPLWYDVMLLSVYAWTGLLLGFVSLYLIHRATTRLAGRAFGWAVVVVGSGLCAFGVALGRFERWNSWDLFARPMTLLSDVLDRAINPFSHPRTSAVTVVFATFLLLGYLSVIALMSLRVEDVREQSADLV